jgi:hypothetical protein
MRRIVAALFALALAVPAYAGKGPSFGADIGANAVWFDAVAATPPNEFEGGLFAHASLQPHISVVGSGLRGFRNEYWHGAGGLRFTATDVDNKDFSIGVGIQYHASDNTDLRPQGWAPDVTLGWAPSPKDFHALTVILQGSYMLDTKDAAAAVGARWMLPIGGDR